jgi:DNA-binding CsgD family transcriptional regulator
MVASSLDFRVISGAELATNGYGAEVLLRSALSQTRQTLELTKLWRELVNGTWRTRASFCSETECFLVLEPCKARPRALAPHVVSMLELVLTGESQKRLAIESRLSRSTVATRCAVSLRGMGSEHTLSSVPILILLAAHAARGMRKSAATLREVPGSRDQCWLVSYERPDQLLEPTLSEAERAVTRLFIEGRTHAQMATIRNVSMRTVANQLGAAFRKLGASGRTALVYKLLETAGLVDPRPNRLH